jgi:acyl-[acyl-carrier-protein]-phospholipid O-acyltransferase/long-chain-fatty-acid--[acyl-carrier-protein] ligase
MVMFEDLLRTFSTPQKLWMLVVARALPTWALVRRYGRRSENGRPAAIIFSSGSTGTPKGVQLTHRNVLANVHSMAQVFDMRRHDVMIGVLPFFHAFGYTGTLWFPLVTGFGAVFHPNPMDAKTIGDLTERHRGTILMSTPTFCSSYVRKCEPNQFAQIRYAVVGAEKLRPAIRGGIPREVRGGAARRVRLHRNVTCGCGKRAGRDRRWHQTARLAPGYSGPRVAGRGRKGG